jgi:ABC-type branched-subunit amino acid transport system substrate-binding protein
VPALLVTATLVLSACSSSKSSGDSSGAPAGTAGGGGGASSGDIKVMVIAPFSLAVAPAKANFDAIRIQADLQNAKGGINGHKIVVTGCDDQSDPNVGAKCAQQAVREKVSALLGVFTLVADSIWPIINQAGIPSIGLVQYAAADMTSPNAWPLTAPAPVDEAAATAYLAVDKGCKAIADVQANAGANSNVPVALNKQVLAKAGAKYVGPYLLTVTNGLANVSAIAKSIADKADCANVSIGENGITLMKAILQQSPNFKFCTGALALPSTWPKEMGADGSKVSAISGLAPDSSTSQGVVDYLREMKAKASGDTLNEFSKLAWASWYAFAHVAGTIQGDITAQSVTAALGKASAVDTMGITATVDFTKASPLAGMQRVFTTQVFVINAQGDQQMQAGDLVDSKKYF